MADAVAASDTDDAEQPESDSQDYNDSLDADDLIPDSNLIILGYNVWPTRASKFQINYIISTDNMAFKYHQVLCNAQFSF